MRNLPILALAGFALVALPNCGDSSSSSTPPPPPPAQITFTPAVSTAPINSISLRRSTSTSSSLTLELVATGLGDVSSLYFDLVFDPSLLSFDRASQGSLFSGGNAQFLVEPDATRSAGGRVVVGVAMVPDSIGISGTGVVGTVTLARSGAGSGGISFESTGAAKPGGDAIAGLTFHGGNVSIQ